MKIRLECKLCKIYVDIPLEQFKEGTGGLFLNKLKCLNCRQVYKDLDLMF